MKANGKRATALQRSLADRRGLRDPHGDWALMKDALDAAERRGEERVLRWMRDWGYDHEVEHYREYRKARRARVGRGRK